MNTYLKIVLSICILLGGVVVGHAIFVSVTELILFMMYLGVSVCVLWKRGFYKLYFLFAAILISLSVILYIIGPTTIRYIHYIDKESMWTYYFFATGVVFSLIDIVTERKTKK